MEESRKEYLKEYYQKNKDKRKKYYEDNKEKILEKRKEYYKDNKEEIDNYRKKYREENIELLKEYMVVYYQENKEHIDLLRKDNKNKDIEKSREYHRQYMRKRVSSDNIFKLSKNLRCLIKKSLSIKIKTKTRTSEIIGCSIEEFKSHIESKFEPWMNWNNWGKYNGELNYGWDIDHIVPLSGATSEDDVYILNHYTNLQPLCSKVNRYIKRDLPEITNCLCCNAKLSYKKYCNDKCRKKYYYINKVNK